MTGPFAETMTGDLLIWATILAMAVGTWATRIGGFWLMRFVPEGGFVARALQHLPGALVIAILAPYALEKPVMQGDWSAPVAILAALAISRLGLSAIFSVFGAVGVVAVLRLVL